VQKIIFQRIFSAGTTKNIITIGTTDPAELATWTALKAASDGTKVVVTPFVSNPEFTPGDPRTFGGGNASVDGIEEILGASPTGFTSLLYDMPAYVIDALKALACEVNLGAWFINEKGRIFGDGNTAQNATTVAPFPIQSLFIGDKGPGGFEGSDTNALNFALPENWSDRLTGITPTDFDAKTQL
jgi:hypothetical protein